MSEKGSDPTSETPGGGAKKGSRRSARRSVEPKPLEQVPLWADLPKPRAKTASRSTAPGSKPVRAGAAIVVPPAAERPAAPPDIDLDLDDDLEAEAGLLPHGDGLEQLLDGLNREQLRAVTHGDGPLLVVAGPGTGKTQVITRRIAWLIATKRALPSQILALTFTEKAADEMQARVDQLVPYGYTDTAIHTFHAFGDRIIREHALELGLPPDLRVLTRPETVIFLRDRLFRLDLDRYRPLGDPTRFLDALAGFFSRCKDEGIEPGPYREWADARVARAREALSAAQALDGADREAAAAELEEAEGQAELAAAYGRYQELLGEAGCIDFGDQVSLAVRLLRGSASVRKELRQRFRYILVDELQDTNRIQSELVALLAEGRGNVTGVGDDDQAIYRFRGAALSNILEFRDHYPGTKIVVLRRNYRSLAPVLETSYRLIRFNDPERLEVKADVSKRLTAQRKAKDPAPVRYEPFASGADEADWVAGEIKRRIEEGKASPRDFAVLVRSNNEADGILRSLNMAGVPWRFSGASGLYSRPEVKLLLAFLRTVADLHSSADLYALATSEAYALGGADLTTIIGYARRRHRSLWETIAELVEQPGILRLGPETKATMAKLVADLRDYAALAHERPAGEVLYEFLKRSGILGRLAKLETPGSDDALGNVARFFEIVRSRAALLADERIAAFVPHLSTLIEAGDDPATVDLDPDADAVAVLTVHKAKGLEFPVVFLVGLVDGRFPTRGRRDMLALPAELIPGSTAGSAADGAEGAGDDGRAEERRLFYVAMTRARDELIMTNAADYGGKRARKVSPFVLEALDRPAVEAPAESKARGKSALESIEKLAPVVAAADVMAGTAPFEGPLTLSFYQVDDYLTCPLKYKYVHVLRVPIAPHHSIVYGAALHAAVQEFHRREMRGAPPMSEDELVAAFERSWVSEGFISREHEEARLAAGRDALRRFREAQLADGATVPTYVEKDFAFLLDGDRIRGRWDRVDVQPLKGGPGTQAEPEQPSASADVVSPVLPLLPPERVVITDYKSSDVRDPAKARERAKESLQLTIYAMGYEAQTGRLPDAVQLHFLESGLIGRAEVDEKRLNKARDQIRKAAAGIRSRTFTPTPDRIACGYCACRDICPASAAR